MIGYLIMHELANLLPYDKPISTLLAMIEVNPDHPAFGSPTKPIGPVYIAQEAERARRRQRLGGQASQGEHASRRPLAAAQADLQYWTVAVAARARRGRDLHRRRDPDGLHLRDGACVKPDPDQFANIGTAGSAKEAS